MALVEIRDLHFSYPDQPRETLSGIDLQVRQGEFIVLCGPSGSGKTTLLRHMKPELLPVGARRGEVLFRGIPFAEQDPRTLAGEIGMVQQDPENQIVMEQVVQELAFGLENLGVPTEAMRRRIAEMAHFFGLEPWMHRSMDKLSGGQKQLVNLAAVLLLQPTVLLLDEPTAQLDPVSAKEFLHLIRRLNEELGLTVVMTEHRLEELFPMASRVVLLDSRGSICADGSPESIVRQVGETSDRRYFDYLPALAKLYLSLENGAAPTPEALHSEGCIPLTVRDGRAWLERRADAVTAGATQAATEAGGVERARDSWSATEAAPNLNPPMVECRELSFQYEKNAPPVLKQLEFTVRERDFLAIVGGNGAGKTTLLQLMAGFLRPQRGKLLFRGKDIRGAKEKEVRESIGYLSQNPLAYFLHDTVEEELLHAVRRSRLADASERLMRLIAFFELEPLLSMHPHDLSGGERQKAALAAVLLAGPRLLLLDEPTKGMDPLMKRAWGELLQTLHREGMTIVLVTHDIEFAAQYVERCAMLFDGVITSEDSTRSFFGNNYFYTTAIRRLAGDRFPNAITYKDVLAQWPEPVSHS